MSNEDAREFAEATLLDVVRGDLGDFRLTIVREGGRYSVQLRAAENEMPSNTVGDSFAEAWLAADGGHPSLTIIRGGRE